MTAATRSPTASAQAAWTAASGVCGAARSRAARSAGGGGPGGAAAAHAASPPRTAREVVAQAASGPRLPGRGRDRVGVGGGDQRLAAATQPLDEPLAPVRVELAHHVVEQKQRGHPAGAHQRLALGEDQRQEAARCSPCEPKRRRDAPAGGDLQLVEVRAPGAPPQAQVGLAPLAGPARISSAPPAGPRRVLERAARLEPQLLGRLGEGPAASSSTASARAAISASAASASAASQTSSSAGAAAGRRRGAAARCAAPSACP